MNFKEELLKVWEEEKEVLDSINPEEDEKAFELQMQRVNEIEKRLTDIERTMIDVKEKATARESDEKIKLTQIEADEQFRNTQHKSEKRDRVCKNLIEIGKFVIPTLAGFGLGIISMKFEDEHVMPLTGGRNALRDIIKFKNW